jgi:hypothetical protein
MEIIWIAIAMGWISLMLSSSSSTRKGSVPRMKNPRALPPKKKKCICNDIEKHSPGGRCKACYSKIKIPKFPEDRIT